MGAVSGSAIVVSTVAVGACVWIGATARSGGSFRLLPSVKKQCHVLAASTMFPLFLAYITYSMGVGVLGFLFYTCFLAYSLYGSGGSGMEEITKKTDDIETGQEEIELLEDEDDDDDEHANTSVAKGVGYLLVGGGLIFVCSSPFISAVVEASVMLKVSPSLLAFFLAPVASEMPEILEAISLSRKGRVQTINVAYSNLIGGTITKTTLLVGLFSFFGVWKNFVWEANYSFSLCLIAFCAMYASLIGFLPEKLKSWHGLSLWALFICVACVQYFLNSQFVDLSELAPNV